jgi:hypothetical protein
VVVRSEASRRKRAVFWRAGRGVVGLIAGRKVASQVLFGGRALVVRWVVRAVARSGVMIGCDEDGGAWWLALIFLFFWQLWLFHFGLREYCVL